MTHTNIFLHSITALIDTQQYMMTISIDYAAVLIASLYLYFI